MGDGSASKQLREVFSCHNLDTTHALLAGWISATRRCRLPACVKLAATITRYRSTRSSTTCPMRVPRGTTRVDWNFRARPAARPGSLGIVGLDRQREPWWAHLWSHPHVSVHIQRRSDRCCEQVTDTDSARRTRIPSPENRKVGVRPALAATLTSLNAVVLVALTGRHPYMIFGLTRRSFGASPHTFPGLTMSLREGGSNTLTPSTRRKGRPSVRERVGSPELLDVRYME
jgi:hypothetical protein